MSILVLLSASGSAFLRSPVATFCCRDRSAESRRSQAMTRRGVSPWSLFLPHLSFFGRLWVWHRQRERHRHHQSQPAPAMLLAPQAGGCRPSRSALQSPPPTRWPPRAPRPTYPADPVVLPSCPRLSRPTRFSLRRSRMPAHRVQLARPDCSLCVVITTRTASKSYDNVKPCFVGRADRAPHLLSELSGLLGVRVEQRRRVGVWKRPPVDASRPPPCCSWPSVAHSSGSSPPSSSVHTSMKAIVSSRLIWSPSAECRSCPPASLPPRCDAIVPGDPGSSVSIDWAALTCWSRAS